MASRDHSRWWCVRDAKPLFTDRNSFVAYFVINLILQTSSLNVGGVQFGGVVKCKDKQLISHPWYQSIKKESRQIVEEAEELTQTVKGLK